VLSYLKRQMKRKMIADGVIVDPRNAPPKYQWEWQHDDTNGVVDANTRGEARALIKKAMFLSPNKRLPMGVQITRRNRDEGCACCACASA
jgi:hypothetical protein